MKNHWLDELKKRLEEESSLPTDVRWDRLRESGIIDERGEVTGHLHRWDAYLAITAVKHAGDPMKISQFRCFLPFAGMPGGAEIDIRRDSMLEYLKQGKKVITAHFDDRLSMWKEGSEVRLSPKDFIRSDSADEMEDNVGSLPEFSQSTSRL